MKTYLFVQLFLVSFLAVPAQPGNARYGNAPTQLYFEHLTTADGLSSNEIWSICQDREGFMWFGTLDGLNKYDGYTFTTFKPNPHQPDQGLQHNVIIDIHEDRQGRLWVATPGGGLHLVDKRTGQLTAFGIAPLRLDLWNILFSIHEDKEGILWLAAGYGLLRFDPDTKQFTQYQTPGAFGTASVAEDPTGRLWVSDGGRRLYQFDRGTGQFTPVVLDSSLAQQPQSWALHVDGEGILWVGTFGDGLFQTDTRPGPLQFTRYNPQGLVHKNIHVNGIYEDREGFLWLATTEGLQRMNRKTDQVATFRSDPSRPNRLSRSAIQTVYQDHTGTLWVGTDTGINKASPRAKKFNAYQLIPTLPSVFLPENTINSILEDTTGTLWLASTTSILGGSIHHGLFQYDLEHQQSKPLPADPADPHRLSSNEVWALHQDHQGQVWIGTTEGLHRWDRTREQFRRYPCQYPVHFIDEDPSGTLWVGGRDIRQSAIAAFDPQQGSYTYYPYTPHDSSGLNHDDLYGILASRMGDIYVGTGGGGINRLNPATGKFTYYLPNHPFTEGHLTDKHVHTFYEDAQGMIWAGTQQGGLNRLDPRTGEFTFFATQEGLPSNQIVSITGDEEGNLWLGTNRGLSRFDPQTKTFRNYTVTDGLPADAFTRGSAQTHQGKLLFGTINGFVVFHPDRIRDNTLVPPVYLTGFKVLEEARPILPDQIELPYQENFLSFEFVALNYEAPEKNQYAYQLEGVDQDWVYSGLRRFASYTELRPGTYTFKVKAANNDGLWNEQGISIPVIIHPPWWRTGWAYGFYALLFIAGVVAVNGYQRRRLLQREREKAREKELAQAKEIEKANKQLEQQKEELQATLEDLQTTQAQLIQKEKMASLGELTAGIAHEIQNPLNFVNNFSEVSQELIGELKEGPLQQLPESAKEEAGEIVSDLEENLSKIHHHGKRADSIVKGMLQHSRASSGEKQPTDLNALAEEYLRLSYHGLRAKDKDFNANLHTDFDPTLSKVAIVPQEIGRVLLNLFNNAFYATQQKKALLNGEYEPQVEVSTKRAGGQVEIRVKDNGIGMRESIKQKIFQPFFTTKPTGEGTGLGLSLSYDIITKGHGGELVVESKEGEYSEFVISLQVR